ncbi:hypothetical protein MN086_06325 [Sulfurovum sp. XGS-02]|uniref:hypothetical protein n=1 Tax=Sulfurovum sp. XGS-02 TaxID=2925411 RepID=UPI00206263C7|nr:hypothetical protein [Sulfurovum sp. XGS-02]UPT76668.1 hypothetical protein MN086_06325 [Sulfurovum sp. XGS-02]
MHNEMIKIKFLTIGEIASSISFFNLEHTYNIHAEKDILKIADTNFFENVDFIFLVADIQDEFVSKHILETISFLMNYEVPFITILPSIKPSSKNITRVLNQITQAASIIIVDDQENKDLDQFIKSLFTMVQIEKIDEYRILEDSFSSTIMLNSIFKAKCIFYLFSNITDTYLEMPKRKRLRFWKLLEKANTVWIDFPSLKKNEVFNEKVFTFFYENIDEDADLFTTYDETKDDLSVNVLVCNKSV